MCGKQELLHAERKLIFLNKKDILGVGLQTF